MKRYSFFPMIIMLLCTACSQSKNKGVRRQQKETPDYELAAVRKGDVLNTIKLPGQLAAYQEVNIFPKINGYVKNVMVDIGSKISKGSCLMTLEAPEMEQDALQAREKYAKAAVDLALDEERYRRLLQASATAGAISEWDLSAAKNKIEAGKALCSAAKAGWEMEKTMQGYLTVTAPFNGVITERSVHPGVLVNAAEKDKPMLELKEVDRLRLQVDIPESLAAALREKDTVYFYLSALPGKQMAGIINRQSGNVNDAFRSERFEIDVNNQEGRLAPGMYADVIVRSKGDGNALVVPKSAVVTSTERKYVLKYDHGKITKVDVSTGNEDMVRIQVFGSLQVDDKVIIHANDEIDGLGK